MLNWIRETGWSFGFNDPTLLGWIMTAAYFLAAALGFHLWQRARREGSPLLRFWQVLAIAVLFLGFNKQLDLQTLFLKSASRIAQASGWYGQKELVRIASVAAAGAAVLAAGIWLFARKRAHLPRDPLLWAAIALVLFFVFVRTSALDGIFRAIGIPLDRNLPAHFLEFVGVFSLAAALLREAGRGGPRPGRSQG
jgi:hypothetical protein